MDKPGAPLDDVDEAPSANLFVFSEMLLRLHLLLGALAAVFVLVGAAGWVATGQAEFLVWVGVYSVIPALGLTISEIHRRRGTYQDAVTTLAFACSVCGPTSAMLVPDVVAPVLVGPAIASFIVAAIGAPRTRRFALWTAFGCFAIAVEKLVVHATEPVLPSAWVAGLNGMVFAALAMVCWLMLRAYTARLDSFIGRLRATRRELRSVRATLADTNKHLEDKVEQRTVAWQKALAEAERAADTRTSFLRTMTHASRTPLHGLLGHVDLLKNSRLDAEQQSYLEQVNERAAELTHIIDDSNLIEQILNEAISEQRMVTDVRWLAQGTVDRLHEYAQARGVSLDLRLGPDVPAAAILDAARARAALDRILRLGIQVSADRRLELVVRYQGADPPCVQFAVRGHSAIRQDRIEAALESSVGEAFAAVEESCASGLIGLNIAATMARHMGGALRFSDCGADGFELSCDVPSHWALPVSEGEGTSARTRRVLVVEDNEMNARILELALSREGFEVDLARNGQEALEACARNAYVTVLMDINMPVMNGIEAAREIRRILPRDRQPPILALTAVEDDGVRNECLCAGMIDILYKPISMPAVCAAVNRAAGV